MYGRLGSIHLRHLTEAGAQRRRTAKISPVVQCTGNPVAEMNLVIFFRLLAVVGIGFGAIAALAVVAG